MNGFKDNCLTNQFLAVLTVMGTYRPNNLNRYVNIGIESDFCCVQTEFCKKDALYEIMSKIRS